MVDIGVRAEKKQIRSVYIILSGGNMEGGQSPTAPGIPFKEGSHYTIVALLESHGKRCKAVLKSKAIFTVKVRTQ